MGAGPAGLTVANLLASLGERVTLLEARDQPDDRVRAIGVTPPTLDILDRITCADGSGGVGQALSARGVHVRRARVFGNGRAVGSLRFAGIHRRYPYILAVPQFHTENLLRAAAQASPDIEIVYGFEAVSCFHIDNGVQAGGEPRDTIMPTVGIYPPPVGVESTLPGVESEILALAPHLDELESPVVAVESRDGQRREGAIVCVCTGKRRPSTPLGSNHRMRKRYRVRFLIGDYPDNTSIGSEAHLYFSKLGSVESFPLPDGIRRWIVQLPRDVRSDSLDGEQAGGILSEWVRKRAGIRLPDEKPLWWSVFQPERSEAEVFAGEGMLLIGDAAHTMSPIGGQGLNTGVADAELAADLIVRFKSGHISKGELSRTYERMRRRAAHVAADRAAISMRTGIRSGTVVGSLRDFVLRALLRLLPDRLLASHFAMLTIPGGRSPYRVGGRPTGEVANTATGSASPRRNG